MAYNRRSPYEVPRSLIQTQTEGVQTEVTKPLTQRKTKKIACISLQEIPGGVIGKKSIPFDKRSEIVKLTSRDKEQLSEQEIDIAQFLRVPSENV
ncbi:MAG: hypothetical protein EZS28_024055 [Streblomastix strix]|uniref:Uncharacterized protein n=1 Tax=Streblomastix strix TaxID=222440 RepID=A0A5J4VD01_9EUKA|nr:MAG: hypothetical protein EZS28_024055 [Streblomastix strix]